jgi:hypothetical protein
VCHLEGGDESACRAACDKKADCTFFVYSSYRYWSSTQCWLKNYSSGPDGSTGPNVAVTSLCKKVSAGELPAIACCRCWQEAVCISSCICLRHTCLSLCSSGVACIVRTLSVAHSECAAKLADYQAGNLLQRCTLFRTTSFKPQTAGPNEFENFNLD